MLKKIAMLGAICLAALLLSSSAFAGPPTTLVKAKQQKLFKLIKQPKTPARQAKLRALFDEMLAYKTMARNALGKKWGERSAKEQAEFSELLTELVRGNYRRNLREMTAYNIEYVGEKPKGKTTFVKTVAKHKTKKREPIIEIDFRVAEVGGKTQVVDIVTERASMVKGYRSQFLRILRKDGFAKLIEKMKKKRDKMAKEG